MKTKMITLAVAVVLAAGVSGCAMFNRGTLNYTRTTTIGKELVDLKEAKDKGALSDAEYAKVKQEIMEGGPLKADAEMKRGCHKDK